ncbi:hypothetical protein BDN70DRAFT_876539 [Pholiota conissans]|uniref:Uncharacterized protein n=1 Tax=Pholiota conissans TaxID=109636 RepID=A0A9P6D2A2_9AGAR|nr:hypothetical protein BDN70DRAFT_876539 [Pholiota conissans]
MAETLSVSDTSTPSPAAPVPSPAYSPGAAQPPPTRARSSHSPPARFEFVSASSALGNPPVERVSKVYATTAEAIAHFKPTPREVISGIAPHVFDERKRRRSSSRDRSKPKPYCQWPYGQKRSSPLRGAMIISWDEHSIYLEQPTGNVKDDAEPNAGDAKATTEGNVQPAPAQELRDDERPGDQQRAITKKRAGKHAKSGWRYLRVDVHLLKSVVEKLKFTNSQNPESSRN